MTHMIVLSDACAGFKDVQGVYLRWANAGVSSPILFTSLTRFADLAGQPNIKGFWISYEPLSFYLFIFKSLPGDGLKPVSIRSAMTWCFLPSKT
jgi:hypothetical protein